MGGSAAIWKRVPKASRSPGRRPHDCPRSFGVTPQIADELFGQDALTSGNHVWDKPEIYDYGTSNRLLLRYGDSGACLHAHYRLPPPKARCAAGQACR